MKRIQSFSEWAGERSRQDEGVWDAIKGGWAGYQSGGLSGAWQGMKQGWSGQEQPPTAQPAGGAPVAQHANVPTAQVANAPVAQHANVPTAQVAPAPTAQVAGQQQQQPAGQQPAWNSPEAQQKNQEAWAKAQELEKQWANGLIPISQYDWANQDLMTHGPLINQAWEQIKNQFSPQQQQEISNTMRTNRRRIGQWGIKDGQGLMEKLKDWNQRGLIGRRAERAAHEKANANPLGYYRQAPPSNWVTSPLD